MLNKQQMPLLHPQHEQIQQTIRGWFHEPMDAMGLYSVVRRWGTYWEHGDIYATALTVKELYRFLTDLAEYYPQRKDARIILGNSSPGTN